MSTAYSIFSLGDSAATIDLGNTIDGSLNDKVIAMQQWMLLNAFNGQKDVIIAYSSLTVVYDPVVIKQHYHATATVFEWVSSRLQAAFNYSMIQAMPERAIVRIPVCYDAAYAVDLPAMAEDKHLPAEEIVALHTACTYRVYTIGFLPGFSYMAAVHDQLVTPRKPRPVPVLAGSVGIAGAQTGIYPVNSPGGWHIIGRTPVPQFDAGLKDPVTLKVGDSVQFYSIDRNSFEDPQWRKRVDQNAGT